MNSYRILALVPLFLICSLQAQIKSDQVYINSQGIMHWSADGSEISGFGVNYTLPFAHEFRMMQKTGVDPEEAIRQDVYHMARLDLDLYRVHVWDTEISDTLGNLLNNDHLKLLDYTLNEMRKRGMKFILTPIAYWGNGWPEEDEATPGFSKKYGKSACLTNPMAIEAQARYLRQFLDHVNPYTGNAYKNEPEIIGFEISNEPHHGGPAENVTAFINKMVLAMRQTGCTKPIFYNMSHSIELVDAYLKADIQGGTFQWYPTNLVANHQINGNFLPHVRSYDIPFANHPTFKKMAKIVYEFDPADVGGNIMYAAMAVAFREAGMQLGAQFAYDAMCWAPYNTNYGTHFMNMAYSPGKAISLKIASAVFHNFALYQKYSYSGGSGPLRISYNDDVAEWVTEDKFFYSGKTATKPHSVSRLKEIAGCSSSPLVHYTGTGAYFLDKVSEGLWRLEVMPDAYWIDDPYSPVSPRKQKAAVSHNEQQMTVSLPDLGTDFTMSPLNKGNNCTPQVLDGGFKVMPGVYLLKRQGLKTEVPNDHRMKNITMDEYVAPLSNLRETVLWNNSPLEVVAGEPLFLSFKTASPAEVVKIKVILSNGDQWKTVTLSPDIRGAYHLAVPEELNKYGFLNYQIIVEGLHDTTSFPGGITGNPWSWEKRDRTDYGLKILPDSSVLVLWDAGPDWQSSFKIWNKSVNLVPTIDGSAALHIDVAQLPAEDPVDKTDRCYAFKFYSGDKIKGRADELTQKKFLVVKCMNRLPSDQPVEIGLIDKHGSVISGNFSINSKEKEYRISISSLVNAPYLVIPRPYPDFLPFKLHPYDEQSFEWQSLEMLQVVVKPATNPQVDLKIEKIWLE